MAEVIFKKIDEIETNPEKSQSPVSEKQDLVSNVSVKQCIGTIIFSLFVCLLVLVPYTFGDIGLTFTFEYLPLIGNGFLLETPEDVLIGLNSLLGLSEGLLDIISYGLTYFTIIFFGIVIFDFLAAILLALFRANGLRVFFKIFSIIFGFVMILIALLGVLYILGVIGSFTAAGNSIDDILLLFQSSGILFVLLVVIFACFLSIKQFRWFAKRW